jgi:predicted CXXCH cytochrome family protein
MINRGTARWRLVLVFVVFTEAITLTISQTSKTAGILRPTDQAVLETEDVQVIARPGELWLDGKSLEERQTQTMRQALSLRIPDGRHDLIWKNGDTRQSIQFIVRTSANTVVPPEWKAYRAHPPQAECQNCHAGKQPGAFKKVTVAETCFTCHEQNAFASGHAHNTEVLAECVLCHNPHGSTEKFHLKMTRETACKQCHG